MRATASRCGSRAAASVRPTFTFTAAVSAPKDVLVLAAEDYSGTHPGPVHPGPEYLSVYTDALQSLGLSYDVYDIDARGRTAPDPLGVLSHYDAVVWYTGDDVFVREPGQPATTGTSRVFGETILGGARLPQRRRQAARRPASRRSWARGRS